MALCVRVLRALDRSLVGVARSDEQVFDATNLNGMIDRLSAISFSKHR